MQSLIDQVSDYTIQTVSTMTLKVSADEASGMGDIDLAVASLGMLQKQAISVRSTIRAEFKGLAGGIQFQGTAERGRTSSRPTTTPRRRSRDATQGGQAT